MDVLQLQITTSGSNHGSILDRGVLLNNDNSITDVEAEVGPISLLHMIFVDDRNV